MSVTAKVTHEHYLDGARTYELSSGHTVQLGYGSGGDGFCYTHQSFECLDNLSPEEHAAIDNADVEHVQEPAAS